MAAIADNFSPPYISATSTATISGTGTLSGAVALDYKSSVVGVITGTGWAAATFGLSVSMDGTSYADLYSSDGIFVTGTMTGAAAVAINPQLTAGWRYTKIKSSANQINQPLIVVKRPV